MKVINRVIVAAAILVLSPFASARDDIMDFSISEALASDAAKNALGDNIKFYFGDQPHPAIVKELSESSTNKKTNAFNKSNKDACNWAFLSAMKSLRDHAKSVGANAVVNIRSNYRNNTTSSPDTFKCGSGALMSGVALIGDVVTIAAP